jgi:hypothetical protein
MIVECESENTCNETFVARFKALSQHIPGGTGGRGDNHYTATLGVA